MRPTYLEINTTCIRHNLRAIKNSLPNGMTCTAVVKANAYGHGSVIVSQMAIEEGYDALAVAIPEEAIPLRQAGIVAPIYLLGLTRPQSFDLIATTNTIPAVCESTDFEALNACASKHNTVIEVAIAVDTGMHRIGIAPTEVLHWIDVIDTYPQLRINGFFSHMANADAADQTHAHEQTQLFNRLVSTVKETRPNKQYRFSLANSAGLLVLTDSLFTDARPGIIQYGIMPSVDVPNTLHLQPALSLHSEVVHVHQAPAGSGIGYGSTYIAPKDMKIATIPIGYADGYPRSLSNKGSVLIKGTHCSIVGRICMDQLMVALPDTLDVHPGEPVILLGSQGDETISVLDIAALADTIPYEIFCGFSERVPRHYL